MTDQIVSRHRMRARARAAFEADKGRDDHGMNPWVAGVRDWQAEWDRLHLERKQDKMRESRAA